MEVPAFRSERRGALCWTGVTSPLLVVVSLLVCSQVPRSRSIALHEILVILANNAGHFPGQGFHRGLGRTAYPDNARVVARLLFKWAATLCSKGLDAASLQIVLIPTL
jgi:hypothetical protein